MTESRLTQEHNTLESDASSLILPFIDDLFHVALSMTGSKETAEDLVSECVVRGLEQVHSLRDTKRSKQWLLRILTNLWLQDRRKERRHGTVQLEEDAADFSFYEAARGSLVSYQHPERSLVQQMLDADIVAALTKLPDHYRVTIQLCDIEEMSYEEIAATLGIPIGTVRSRIARARGLLQSALWQHALDHGLTPTTKALAVAEDPNCNCKE